MSATAAPIAPGPTCPSWCQGHSESIAHTACLSADVELMGMDDRKFRVGLAVVGSSADDRPCWVDIEGHEFTLDGAREVVRSIERLIDMATPADPGYIAALRTSADAAGITLDVPEQASQADVRRLAFWLGEQIAERRS